MDLHTTAARFDRFDICEAWHIYADRYHNGQASKEYKVFGRLANIGFRPSPIKTKPKHLTRNGRIIYAALLRNKGKFIRG